MKQHNYFAYITTNQSKTVIYTGVTNDLKRRLFEHEEDSHGQKLFFAGKYNCYHLVYYERFQFVQDAIRREKEIKGWKRSKKDYLISEFNPEWRFLNDDEL
ncbi:MAG: GIY-YIG nuclease family protein [Bacteroidales bacterium]|nr:GIY-YIG nuclease family protein [Bacteroidales bacterium]